MRKNQWFFLQFIEAENAIFLNVYNFKLFKGKKKEKMKKSYLGFLNQFLKV